ncbi:MAG: class I SAM-dependent methyltransferase [Marinoscillum sp.]
MSEINHKSEAFLCQICNSSEHRVLFNSKTTELGDIVRCAGCGFVTVHPMPSEAFIAQSYNGLYKGRESLDRVDPVKSQQVQRTFDAYLRGVGKKGLEPKAFLDVGGGLGYFSGSAIKYGLEATLIDLDNESLDFAKGVLGVSKVFQGTLETFAAQTAEKYDLILLRHEIEHLPDPATIMKGIANLLSENGLAIVETPNNASFEAFLHPNLKRNFVKNLSKYYEGINHNSIVKKKVYAMRPPIHLNAFSMKTLIKIGEKNGLTEVDNFTYKLGDKDYWPNFKLPTIRKVVKHLVKFRFGAALQEVQGIIKFVVGRELLSKNNYSGLHIKVKLKTPSSNC